MTETMFQGLLGRLPIGYCAFDVIEDVKGGPAELRFAEANAAFEQMTGPSFAGLSEKPVLAHFRTAGQDGFDWAGFFEKALASADRDSLIRYAEIRERQYKLTGFFPEQNTFAVLLWDLTEDLASERTLRRQKQELEAVLAELEVIFNSAQDAIFLMAYDGEKFSYIRNNRRHQELTGYTSEEMYGKTPYELLGEETGAIVEKSYLRCIALGESITFEETLTMRRGTRDWLTNLSPVPSTGALRYVVGCRTDITEVKKLRMEQENHLKDLQAMFSEHSATMLLIDPGTGRLIEANPAACDYYGYSRDELLELTIQDINMLPEEEVLRRRMMASAGRQVYFLFPHRLKSGEIRLVDVYSSPISYGGRRVLFSIIFDVTDREDYREAMNREREL
ncbi:MAG TPA: PAS domain S-box protein, partial [Terriglobales bacterium]|nr:PAS domain S-box protein [Terriglobales bacterium]